MARTLIRSVRRVVAVFAAAASLLFVGLAVPAFASPVSGDTYSCGLTCLGLGWEVVAPDPGAMVTALGVSNVRFKVSQHSSGVGVPPDPTENVRIGYVETCRATPELVVPYDYTDIVWGPAHSFAYWDVTDYEPIMGPVCGVNSGGGTVVYLALVKKEWNNLFGSEPTSFTTAMSVGTNECPYAGGNGNGYKECKLASGTTTPSGAASITIVGHGTEGGADYVDIAYDVTNCTHPYGTALAVVATAEDNGVFGSPSFADRALNIAFNVVLTDTGTVRQYLQPYGSYDDPDGRVTPGGLDVAHEFVLYCAFAWADAGGECNSTFVHNVSDMLDMQDCWDHRATDGWEPDSDAGVPDPCGFSPNSSAWQGNICATVVELQKVNQQLSQMVTSLRDLHVDVTVTGGGGDGSGTTDTTGCGSGLITSMICLTKNIADALGGLGSLLQTLFVPSSSSYDAMSTMSTSFSTHPPGSLLTGAFDGMTSLVTSLSSNSCQDLPAIVFPADGPLQGTSVSYPSMCGGGVIASEPTYHAAYELCKVFIYGLLVFALWRKAKSAFGGKDE